MTDDTETRPAAKEKPVRVTDIPCPACGAMAGMLCSRAPRGLSRKVMQQTACYARSRNFLQAHGLGRRYSRRPKRAK